MRHPERIAVVLSAAGNVPGGGLVGGTQFVYGDVRHDFAGG